MSRLPSVMSHNFSNIPHTSIPRSSFDRSHGYKTTIDSAGLLIPFYIDEALPGDTFSAKLTAFARLATPVKPIMDNMRMTVQFFSVPVRLVWDNWQKFNGEQTDPGDSIDYTVPTMTSTASTGYAQSSLHDYFGIPIEVPDLVHSSLWHRAYNLIWNEWYRDENLQDSVVVDKDDGPDSPADYVLLRRGKRHDYFTSCLPWPQKGDAVSLSLSGNAPVTGIGSSNQIFGSAGVTAYESGGTSGTVYASAKYVDGVPASNNSWYVEEDPNNSGYPGIYANLSELSAFTINELREAFQVQKLLERDARGGTRYTEILRSHFGVVSPDARLQRPEYLGGGVASVIFNPVAQTSSTDATTPQANLSAIATSTMHKAGFHKSFVEHCLLIGLVSFSADLTYQQGLNRMFSRSTRYDFYWPSFAHLGEQAVLNKEIYAQGTSTDDEVFGYQEIFAEYRYKPSLVTGQFRSNPSSTSLDIWHLAQDFASLPSLNASFIEDNPPVDRIVAVTEDYPQFFLDTYMKLKCARPMPVYSVPGLIDHF